MLLLSLLVGMAAYIIMRIQMMTMELTWLRQYVVQLMSANTEEATLENDMSLFTDSVDTTADDCCVAIVNDDNNNDPNVGGNVSRCNVDEIQCDGHRVTIVDDDEASACKSGDDVTHFNDEIQDFNADASSAKNPVVTALSASPTHGSDAVVVHLEAVPTGNAAKQKETETAKSTRRKRA